MSEQWIFKYWINGEEVIQWLRHKPARLCVVKRIILQQTAGVQDVLIGCQLLSVTSWAGSIEGHLS
jgi:hypothetical protein